MRTKWIGLLIALMAVSTACADPPGHRWMPRLFDWSRLSMPTETKANVGYYVGGGNPFPHFAEPRDADEGTWGWDYQGRWLPRRVANGWWHGRKYQGGTGAYKTDGPKLLP